jgi:hypothetical protein
MKGKRYYYSPRSGRIYKIIGKSNIQGYYSLKIIKINSRDPKRLLNTLMDWTPFDFSYLIPINKNRRRNE